MIQVSQSVVGVKEGQEVKVEEKAVIRVNDREVSTVSFKKDSGGRIVVTARPKSK